MFTIVPDKSVDDVFTEAMWDTFIRDNLNTGVIRPIAEVELAIAAASIDFTSIAADWSHLLLILYTRGDTAAVSTTAGMRFNADSGGNYDFQRITGGGATASAAELFAQSSIILGSVPAGTATSNVFGGGLILLPHYAQAANHKCALSLFALKTGTTTGSMNIDSRACFWRSASAINQVSLLPAAGSFVAGTRATLLGVGGV